MSDLGKNIQRIANTEELQRQINELQGLLNESDKPPIGGTRSSAHLQPGGAVGTSKGDAGSEQFKNEFDGAINELGGDVVNFADNGDSLNGTGDLLDGTYIDANEKTAQDIFDGNVKKGEKLSGIIALKDCATGDSVEINLNGQFTPPSYGDTDNVFENYNADTDPRESQFVAGTHYELTVLTPHKDTSVYGVVTSGLPEYDTNDGANAPHTIANIATYDETTLLDGGTISVTINRAVSGPLVVAVSARVGICSIGVDAWCPASSPVNDWDSDGVHQLSFDGATFSTHPNEADADQQPALLNNPSLVSLCTSGGDPVDLLPSGDGGLTLDFGSGVVYRAKADEPGGVMKITETPGDFTIP